MFNKLRGQSKKVKLAKPEPREMDAIRAEYNQLCQALGQSAYQKHVYERECEALNRRLFELNQEGGERQRLDAEKKAASEASKPAQEPQS